MGPIAVWAVLALLPCCLCVAIEAKAADLSDAEALFQKGEYDACARLAASEIKTTAWNERWYALKIEAELACGRYEAARDDAERAARRYPHSVGLRLQLRSAYRRNGQDKDAERALIELDRVVMGSPQRFARPEERVALGRYFGLKGADPKKILELCYDPAIKERPDLIEAHLAVAELALEKGDFALAAETLRKAPAPAARLPRFHCLLARAYAPEDRAGADRELDRALEINPNHVDGLLLRAEHQIDAENYDEAGRTLKRALEVNPREPRAFAYQSVIAHLRNDPEAENAARGAALSPWAANPEVDHLIGRGLSRKYRFAEGSIHQRRALALAPRYWPARLQLCQDLLRLGQEDEGWKLAAEVFEADPYNVVAYNLTTLRDQLKGFKALRADGLLVRMAPNEAELYGARVLELLARARKTLCAKYDVVPPETVTVEIFPRRNEFAVRTFGLPGADGLLGVCFGPVITATSPAARAGNPANWEAVLWHEFCHVVTLSKTKNTMPRWLSEGISVYEEERADPSWADGPTPRSRAMLLGPGLTPLSRLSSAFLAPKSAEHLQFAYRESALAVAFLIERAGLPALKAVLDDLGAGVSLNEALPARLKMTLKEIDEQFARFARARAERMAPSTTWEPAEAVPDGGPDAVRAWLDQRPKSFFGWQRLAGRLIAEKHWDQALAAVQTFRDLFPEYAGPENAYAMSAAIHRNRADPKAERQALEAWAARDGAAAPALRRLLELDEAAGDWSALKRDAMRYLAVDPLIAAPHRGLAHASERLGRLDRAIAAHRALARLDNHDPADAHFQIARLLAQANRRDEARREVLRSLEEAPRFLEAHRLLLDLVERGAAPPARPPKTQDDP